MAWAGELKLELHNQLSSTTDRRERVFPACCRFAEGVAAVWNRSNGDSLAIGWERCTGNELLTLGLIPVVFGRLEIEDVVLGGAAAANRRCWDWLDWRDRDDCNK